MSCSLRASVVIPTHARRTSLVRVLRALDNQTTERSTFEVIVVCDGDTDGSAETCRALTSTLRYQLRVIVQQNQGPAAARNKGVAEANAPLIVFIDDDVVPDEHLLATHMAAHERQDRCVAIGPLLPPPDAALSPWANWEERVLLKQYDDMMVGRWKATYRQFYTGNASILKHHIVEAGGFDPAYRRAEDVELALRLRDRGLSFEFLPQARGWHYVQRSYESWLRMSSAYADADVMMAKAGRHEVLSHVYREYPRRSRIVRIVTELCVGRPRIYATIIAMLGTLITVATCTRATLLGHVACSLVFNVRYYEGLAAALGGRHSFKQLLRGQPVVSLLPHPTSVAPAVDSAQVMNKDSLVDFPSVQK